MKPEREAGTLRDIEPLRSRWEAGEWGPWTSVQACQMALITAYRAGAEAQREHVDALEKAANLLIDYCEDHDWGRMPEPFDSINPLLALLGRSAPIEGEKE